MYLNIFVCLPYVLNVASSLSVMFTPSKIATHVSFSFNLWGRKVSVDTLNVVLFLTTSCSPSPFGWTVLPFTLQEIIRGNELFIVSTKHVALKFVFASIIPSLYLGFSSMNMYTFGVTVNNVKIKWSYKYKENCCVLLLFIPLGFVQ